MCGKELKIYAETLAFWRKEWYSKHRWPVSEKIIRWYTLVRHFST